MDLQNEKCVMVIIEKMKEVSEIDLNYYGIAICGAKKKINKLTGSMPLLR
jgi:hypothetical protein